MRKAITQVEPHRVPIPRGTPSYIQEAIKALDSANPDDREGAIDNLAQSTYPVAVESLVGALSHPLQDVRIFAALARGEAGDPRAIPHLLEALQYEDITICRRAISALGNVGDASVVSRLIELLHHRPEETRRTIAETLV